MFRLADEEGERQPSKGDESTMTPKGTIQLANERGLFAKYMFLFVEREDPGQRDQQGKAWLSASGLMVASAQPCSPCHQPRAPRHIPRAIDILTTSSLVSPTSPPKQPAVAAMPDMVKSIQPLLLPAPALAIHSHVPWYPSDIVASRLCQLLSSPCPWLAYHGNQAKLFHVKPT